MDAILETPVESSESVSDEAASDAAKPVKPSFGYAISEAAIRRHKRRVKEAEFAQKISSLQSIDDTRKRRKALEKIMSDPMGRSVFNRMMEIKSRYGRERLAAAKRYRRVKRAEMREQEDKTTFQKVMAYLFGLKESSNA